MSAKEMFEELEKWLKTRIEIINDVKTTKDI